MAGLAQVRIIDVDSFGHHSMIKLVHQLKKPSDPDFTYFYLRVACYHSLGYSVRLGPKSK